MDRVAVFVDAGYLFAAGSMLIAGEKLTRGQLSLNTEAVLSTLNHLATQLSGLPLLRIYWYDGTSQGPTNQQLTLANQPSVKLRLGFVNQSGEQKGVDSLIVTDMITLARNRAMADAVLLTGDEDIRVGVQQAQEYGVRVHLLGIAPRRNNQSPFLVQEADSVYELEREQVQVFLSRQVPLVATAQGASAAPLTGLAPPAAVAAQSSLEEVAEAIARGLAPEEREAVLLASRGGQIPAQVDQRLLRDGSGLLGRRLNPAEKSQVREAFRAACRRLLGL